MPDPIQYDDVVYTEAEREKLREGIRWDPQAEIFYLEGTCPSCQDGPVRILPSSGGIPIPGPRLSFEKEKSLDGDTSIDLDVACFCGIDHPISEGDEESPTEKSCGRSVKGLGPAGPSGG